MREAATGGGGPPGCNADWWQAKAAETAEQRQQAERLVAQSERKQEASKRAYEEAVKAADEARRKGVVRMTKISGG